MIDLRAALFDQSIDGFKAIGRLEGAAECPVDPELMQRQGLPQTFRQASGCGLVPLFQFVVELLKGSQGLLVIRAVVGSLESLTPLRLFALGQVADYVLALVPFMKISP